MPYQANEQAILERAKAYAAADPFLSIKQLSAALNVSVRTIRRRHAEGLGPSRVKRGRKLMYDRHQLDEWLASR